MKTLFNELFLAYGTYVSWWGVSLTTTYALFYKNLNS